MEATPLASLSLTHVHYNPSDPLSYVCAWLALVPQGLCVTYVTLIWATREVEIILMFVGQMGCEALNFLLKRLIKEERPKQMNGKGYGMPSSHAQFLAFFSVFLTLFLLIRHTPRSSPSHTPATLLQRLLLSLFVVLMAAAVSLSRIYLNYHTSRQVLAGCTAGAMAGLGWFVTIWWLRREGWVDWALEISIVKALRVRDLVLEEDVVQAGWREWEYKKQLRRKLVNKEVVMKHS